MLEDVEVMALPVTSNMCVTVGNANVWVVPGDVIVDSPDGTRRLFHRMDFEKFIEEKHYDLSGDRGYGWVILKPS